MVVMFLLFVDNPGIETVNFVSRSNTKWGTLINSINLNIQDGTSSNTIRTLSTCLFDQKSEWSSLEGQTKLSQFQIASTFIAMSNCHDPLPLPPSYSVIHTTMIDAVILTIAHIFNIQPNHFQKHILYFNDDEG